ncbi:hypothetical protein JCM3770_000599 [Rhodotorula araucariae]
MEWSWDGSIISLSSVSPIHSPPIRPRTPSSAARSLEASHTAISLAEGQSQAGFGTSSAGDSAVLPTPPERAYLLRESHAFASGPTSPSPSLDPHPHPLTSFLLAEHSLSPPASPTASATSSFPASRTRLSSAASGAVAGGDPAIRSRSNRRRPRGRARASSVSSTASTDGSARAERASEVSSSEDDRHAGGLVMPSLHLGGNVGDHANAAGEDGRGVKVLVLGKTREDRRTLATLLARDDDLRRTPSGGSLAAATDMSFSFLSMLPSTRPASSGNSAPPKHGDGMQAVFEPLVPSSAPVALYHLARQVTGTDQLLDELTRPLERLEAKLNRAYPTTTGLEELVQAAGCGEFEACLFLFSSPPHASEIAIARPVSHILPLYPVLVLPPSPTGKPQKTMALSHAVQDQLDTAGVRWLAALTIPHSLAPAPARPLYMLPHDLFVQHVDAGPHVASSTASTHTSSPTSEDAPASLFSSTEFSPLAHTASTCTSGPNSISDTAPHSAARSLSASSRADTSSSRSSSPHRGPHERRRQGSVSSLASSSSRGGASAAASTSTSTSLADLRRLQATLHHSSTAGLLRSQHARAFLEWREVEVAASSSPGASPASEVPPAWGESPLRDDDRARGGRRALDFSKRVAERRRVLALRRRGPCVPDDGDDGDVLAASDDDAEECALDGGSGAARASASYATDPMTPRCAASRVLHSPFAARCPPAAAAGDSYFPPQPAPTDTLASSMHSLASGSSGTSGSASSGAASVLVLPSADPFHLPSLLHLVGLNLRLAVFAPSFASSPAASFALPSSSYSSDAASSTSTTSTTSSAAFPRRERDDKATPRDVSAAPAPAHSHSHSHWAAWWRAAAVVGLVFAAGVGVGALVADAGATTAARY